MASITVQGVTDTLKPEDVKYEAALKAGAEAFERAFAIFQDPEYASKKGWRVEVERDVAQVHSKSHPFGTVFALQAELPAPIDVSFRESVEQFEGIAAWHPNIVFSDVVARLTEHVAIIHYANPDVAVVKSRDYLAVRLWRHVDSQIYVAAKSVKLPEVKERKECVRGEVVLGCARFTPAGDKTKIEYLLCLDLKGFIPKSIVNVALGKLMVTDYEETHKRYEEVMRNESK